MICKDRVVIVTGAGRGLGRAHALALAEAGAKVVVNDLGVSLAGGAPAAGPAELVVEEIRAAGGQAVADGHDIADWEGAGALFGTTLAAFGRVDAVVNNAGIVRDGMFVKADVAAWDAVMRVHLRGHFCLSRHAAAHWRAEAKAGRMPDARIVNTSSGAGLQGSVGQAAYSTAKAGIAGLTLVQATELRRYGVCVNAIAPAARTRMTEGVFPEMMRRPEKGFDAMDPANVSPLVVWLCSPASAGVTGRAFEVQGGRVWLSDGWRPLPGVDAGRRWRPEELTEVVGGLIDAAPTPAPVYGASEG